MNWKFYDRARRNSTELEIDLIDHFAAGKISRRDFVRRGAILGMGVPMMAGIIAACGDDDDGGGTDAAARVTNNGVSAPADSPTQGGNLNVAVQFGDANSGLDPVNMLDLGTYAVVSQSFEYLVGLGPDGQIGDTGLATNWTSNSDVTEWTFDIRPNVSWHDGSQLTSADVAATIDRMVVSGAGLAGIVSEGAVDSSDPLKAVVRLDKPNGNLPVLLSIYNPQSLITPADYSDGTTLDARPAGTGPWILDDYDPTTFTSRFVRNENWWGGSTILDSITLRGFESAGTKTAAMAAREVDLIQDFSVIDGGSLLTDDKFVTLQPPSSNHRQLWFNTQDGQFTDARARQAVGYAINRQQIVSTLYEGNALVANDHPVHPTLPFFDSAAVDQRPRDLDMAKQLLSDAGFDGLTSTLQVGQIGEVPAMAAIVEANCAEAGINLSVNVTDNSDFYGQHWCPGASWGALQDASPGRPCGTSNEIGIVDYGHRPTPDIFFGRALATDGDWNSSNYASPEFDKLFTDYQAAGDVAGQQAAVSGIMQLLHQDSPAVYSSFFDFLGGHDESVSGVQITALGHMQLHKASKA